MRVDRVKYTKYFKDTDEWMGVEIVLEEGESTHVAFAKAKDSVESEHVAGSGVNRSVPFHTELPVIQKDSTVAVPGISANDIVSCNSLVVLDAYKTLIKDNENLMVFYKMRRSELVKEEADSIISKTDQLTKGAAGKK